MPRNSSGVYTLPAGNPVVTGTTITVSWANGTMPDLGTEIQDSLSRSGKGGMNAPLKNVDGSESLPAFTYNNDTTSGWYRISAGTFGYSVSGSEVFRVTSSAITLVSGVSFVLDTVDINGGNIDGTIIGATTPAAGTFTTFTSTGIDDNATSVKFTLSDTTATFDGIVDSDSVYTDAGTAAAPTHTFTDDTDIGMYRVGANQLGFATAGVVALVIDASGNVDFQSNDLTTDGDIFINRTSKLSAEILSLDYSSSSEEAMAFNNTVDTSSDTYLLRGYSQSTSIGQLIQNNASFGMRTSGSNSLVFKPSGTLALTLDSSQNANFHDNQVSGVNDLILTTNAAIYGASANNTVALAGGNTSTSGGNIQLRGGS